MVLANKMCKEALDPNSRQFNNCLFVNCSAYSDQFYEYSLQRSVVVVVVAAVLVVVAADSRRVSAGI